MLSLPASTIRTLPPAGIDRQPSPLLVPGGGDMLFVPPSPVHPPFPTRVTCRLLLFSEVKLLLGFFLSENLRSGHLHYLVIARPRPRPRATRPCRRRSGYPPSPPPLVAMIPSLLVEVVWGVALGEVFTCRSSSHRRGCLVCKTE